MIKIHKEGTFTILVVLTGLAILNLFVQLTQHSTILDAILLLASLVFFLFVLSFFRKPKRNPMPAAGEVLSPCDGKVVVIEETDEPEYFRGRRIQVSVFMSPLNVHVNYHPLSGEVRYVKYHPGRHMVAWHPKSSEENERSTVVVAGDRHEILTRQIAGTVARRIVTYAGAEDQVSVGDELGFIKFGSRVDLFLPVGSEITVKLNDTVTGAKTVIGKLPL